MKFLHVCIRVGNLEKSVEFYEKALGYKVSRKLDNPGDFTLVYLEDPETGFELELTYNYGVESYEIGNGYSHFAVKTDDVKKSFERHKEMGITSDDEPYTIPGGSSSIYFITDPDGYEVEIIGPKIK